MVNIYILRVMKRKLNGICMRSSHVFEVLMIIMGMRSGKTILKLFSYIVLTSKQKCHYAQMELVEKAFCWRKCSHIDYRYWFVLKNLRTLYALHFYSSEAVYKEPEVVDEPEPEAEAIHKSEPEALMSQFQSLQSLSSWTLLRRHSEVVDEAELGLEVEKPHIETLVDFSAELIMELVPSSTIYP